MSRERIDVASSATQPGISKRLLKALKNPKALPKKVLDRLLGTRVFDWDANAEELGAYSVIDGRHDPGDYDYVTKRTKEILYPLFQGELNGTERVLLDFGCGPGRFTADLAGMIGGRAIGADVTKRLIELAETHPNVAFLHSKNILDEISRSRFDVIFICCVLGGLGKIELPQIAFQLAKVLARDGLLFIVESTSINPVEEDWRSFTNNEIVELFPEVDLNSIGVFHDAGQERTVFAGRKRTDD